MINILLVDDVDINNLLLKSAIKQFMDNINEIDYKIDTITDSAKAL